LERFILDGWRFFFFARSVLDAAIFSIGSFSSPSLSLCDFPLDQSVFLSLGMSYFGFVGFVFDETLFCVDHITLLKQRRWLRKSGDVCAI
jgi:hypothetical protein